MGNRIRNTLFRIPRWLRVIMGCVLALVGGSLLPDAIKVTRADLSRGWEHSDTALVVYAVLFGLSLFVFLFSLFRSRCSR